MNTCKCIAFNVAGFGMLLTVAVMFGLYVLAPAEKTILSGHIATEQAR